MHKEIGIDLGSSVMLVSTAEEAIIAREPTVVAVRREDKSLMGVGRAAEEVARDPSKDISLIRPLRDGLFADPEATRLMIDRALHLTCGNHIIKPRVLIGVPFTTTEEEENLLEWTAIRAGARETFFVYTPIAVMAGLNLPPDSAALIVDIGASQTSLMLIGGGKILYKNTVAAGGDDFNAAIVSYLAKQYGVRISTRSAEAIKLRIGTVWIHHEDKKVDIKGKSIQSGELVTVRLSSREMFDALEEPTACLIAAVCEAISKIPSPYVGEVFSRGILLSGGGAMLDGLDKMISGVTGVGARVVDRPDEITALGLGKILADMPTSMKNQKTNVSLRCMRLGI